MFSIKYLIALYTNHVKQSILSEKITLTSTYDGYKRVEQAMTKENRMTLFRLINNEWLIIGTWQPLSKKPSSPAHMLSTNTSA